MSDNVIFNANISYQYSFTIFSPDSRLSDDEKFQIIKNNVLDKFPDSVVDSSTKANEEKALAELSIAQSFLHGGGLPFPCRRILIRGMELCFPDRTMRETAVLLTIFPHYNVAQLQLCFNINNATTDRLIYLRQIFSGSAEFSSARLEAKPLSGWSSDVIAAMGCICGSPELTYLIEIKSFQPYSDLTTILNTEMRRLYGIICGDEGWEYVPEDLAREHLSCQWGSRNFVKFIAFGTDAMLINLNSCPDAEAYLRRQYRFAEASYGGLNPYFTLDSSVAGINHGIFFSQEMVMVVKTMAESILRRQYSFSHSSYINLSKSIRLTKQYRTDLITTLNQLERIGITELGELEQVLVSSCKITQLIDSIKYLLELLESDLDLLYQQSTNRLVNILTFAGLLLSVLGLLADFSVL